MLDLHSGQLHKHFHETLDERIAQLQKAALEQLAIAMEGGEQLSEDGTEPKPPGHLPPTETSPPPSIFKELKPSGKRYSLLQKKEEL